MRSSRSLAIATAVVFGISTIFSVVASLLRDASSLPIIVGEMDGVLAFVLVVMAMVLWVRTQRGTSVLSESHGEPGSCSTPCPLGMQRWISRAERRTRRTRSRGTEMP